MEEIIHEISTTFLTYFHTATYFLNDLKKEKTKHKNT
jgi:hypothetical protein